MRYSLAAAFIGLSTMTLAAPAPDQGSGNGKTHSQSFTSGTHGFKVPIPAGPKGYKPTGAASGSPESIANMKDKIKNVVHILMENRSFDNIVGGQTSIPVDGPARNGPFCNAVNITDPNSAVICSQAKDFDSITNDPDHSIAGNNFQNYGTFMPDNAAVENGTFVAGQQGFLQDHLRKYPKLNATYAAAQVMNYYTPDQVPVITSFCENFVTFDKWHSCVPGPTNPNRMCTLSGTSAGHGSNNNDFNDHSISSLSIFEQLTSQGITWKNYDGTNGAFKSDALFYNWTYTAKKTSNVVSLEEFFQDALLGTLPAYSYINPSCCGITTNSMHPTGPVSTGEVLLKQIYDALRVSPQWKDTLLIVSFDEAGGFYDHNEAPTAVRPDNLTYTEKTPDGQQYTFNFDRYGGRLPQWIISPWVAKAHVEHTGTNAAGQTDVYSATSVLRTLGYLWDFAPFTPRVEASPSFDHLITKSFRKNLPESMPVPKAF